MSDIVERLRNPLHGTELRIEAADEIERLRAQVEDARQSFLAIQKATVEGHVCDDVAWFSQIETLHDYCGSAADRLAHPSTVRDDA